MVKLPKLMPMSELLTTHPNPVECIVENFLPRGGLSLLVAMPKAGKSTLARNLMVAVGSGSTFFGRMTISTPVIYFALEEPIEHVANEFRLIGATSEAIYTRVGHIPKVEVAKTLENDIVEYRAGLAVIDPLFDMLQVDDVNNYGAMNAALKDILYIARKTKCHIMVLHHTNKRDIHGGLSVLGSQATSGATDHNAFLTIHKGGQRYFETQARVGEPFVLSEIGFDPDTHKMWLGDNASVVKKNVLAEELFIVLGDLKLTTTDWRNKVKGRNSDKAAAIKFLESEGKVAKHIEDRHSFWTVVA